MAITGNLGIDLMLIECPECGREVSSGAQACPECAYPLEGRGRGRGSSRLPPVVQTRGGSGLELTKQILGRVIFGGILLAIGGAALGGARPMRFGTIEPSG